MVKQIDVKWRWSHGVIVVRALIAPMMSDLPERIRRDVAFKVIEPDNAYRITNRWDSISRCNVNDRGREKITKWTSKLGRLWEKFERNHAHPRDAMLGWHFNRK